MKRRDAVADLVDEVRGTLHGLTEGHLDARATFDADERAVDELQRSVAELKADGRR
ncbi:hypothetical protein [Haloplanus salinus]|uniref:hypothetical protein n=1 Tax=Haloplanus salinus TaxID=1126245 RepID=UPI0015F0B824|nr:hypothetical protein [Haloplanus salinus]